jgi:hypothetical protein
MHLCVRVDVEQGWQKLLMDMTFQLGMYAGMFYLLIMKHQFVFALYHKKSMLDDLILVRLILFSSFRSHAR